MISFLQSERQDRKFVCNYYKWQRISIPKYKKKKLMRERKKANRIMGIKLNRKFTEET